MDELVLEPREPALVTPAKTIVLWNPMESVDTGEDINPALCKVLNPVDTTGNLYVSTHGDIYKKWLVVEPGDYVKFSQPTYFLQKSAGSVILPAYEITSGV